MFAIINLALVNLLLSSDNVLIIALLGQHLSKKKRVLVLLGSMLASLGLQLGILFIVSFLFHISFLQSLFGVVICYMAFHLLHKHEPEKSLSEGQTASRTIMKIVLGNLMMSFENEATLIGLTHGAVWPAWFGMALSAPVIFFGSRLIVWLLHKFDFIVYAGSIILFKIGLDLIFELKGLQQYVPVANWVLTGVFAIYVIGLYLDYKGLISIRSRLH